MGSLWYIDKERLSGSFTLHGYINRIQVNPFKQTEFSVSGKNYFKIWELDLNTKNFEVNKESTKAYEILQNENIIDHCWLTESNYMIAANSENVIYIFCEGQFIKKFDFKYIPSELKAFNNIENNPVTEEDMNEELDVIAEKHMDTMDYLKQKAEVYTISCIEATSRGFAIGLKNIGAICIYEIGKNNKLSFNFY